MQEKEPWQVVKKVAENPEAQASIDNCLHLCLQLTANLAILANPFLPFTAKEMLHKMKVVDKMLEWKNAGQIKLLSVGYSLREPKVLFRQIDDTEIAAQVEKLKAGLVASQQDAANDKQEIAEKKEDKPLKEEIQFDD